jgi:hypothetical protein
MAIAAVGKFQQISFNELADEIFAIFFLELFLKGDDV